MLLHRGATQDLDFHTIVTMALSIDLDSETQLTTQDMDTSLLQILEQLMLI